MPVGAVIGTVGAAAAKESWICFKPHFDYVKDLDKNYKELEREYGYFTAAKDDMIKEIESGIIKIKNATTTYRCDHLLGNVSSTESKFQELQAKHKKAYKYLWGMCPFFNLRKLGEHVVETKDRVVRQTNEMKELMKERKLMDETTPKQVAPKIVDLNSLSQNVQHVLKLLQNNKRIGIHGARGVGKTTLLKKLRKEAKKNGKFDHVILISCQREDGERKILEDLVRKLKRTVVDGERKILEDLVRPLTPTVASMEDAADQISEILKEKKYLLILDHVYSGIELRKVGISRSHDYGKVIIASTDEFYCREMGATGFFCVKTLPLEDALALFREIVGEVVDREDIKDKAEQIVKQLGTLPRLIRAVASTLRGATESKWDDMLDELKLPIKTKQSNTDDVYAILKYVCLKLSVEQRSCLCYVALFPRGHEIYGDYLVEYWRVQGLIKVQGENDKPFRRARDKGHTILKNFEALSLLERCQRVTHLKMPEELRRLALGDFYRSEKTCQLLVREKQTEEHPPEKDWNDADGISLMCNKLPRSPKCRKLITLLLQRNKNLTTIPKPFFAHMSELKILDLFQTEIEALPPSLFSLINLQGLYLNSCGRLKVLSSKIAKLQNLEVLDIRCTGIQSLPVEIGQLNNLKCFRFSLFHNDSGNPTNSRCKSLQFWKRKKLKVIIPPNLVKKLHQLEELTIIIGPTEQTWSSIVNDIAKEVASLKVLSTLCFHFPDVKNLKTFTTSWSGEKFRSCKLLVGNHETNKDDSSVDSAERLLRYSAGQNIPGEIGMVLKQATAFELIDHENVKSLSEFGTENMKSLEVCVIEKCEKIESICTGTVVEGSLVNLRALTLNGCPKLTKILSLEILQLLRQLQRLTVENCSEIMEIIETENQCQSTEIGEAENHAENRCQITKVVKAKNHSQITTEIVGGQNQSQSTEIGEAEKHCEIREVVEAENRSQITTKIVEAENQSQSTKVAEVGILSGALPKLEILKLINLPKLVSISESDTFDWPCLEKIEIRKCRKLSKLSLSTTNASELRSILCNKHWWEGMQQSLEDDLRQRIQPLCSFIHEEEQPCVPGTSPGEKGCSSSSMNPAAGATH